MRRKMELNRVFWLFIYKQLLFLRFHWRSLAFLLGGGFAVQCLILHFTYRPIEPLHYYSSPDLPETLADGCYFDSFEGHSQTFYAPNTPEVQRFMEEKCGSDLNVKSFTYPETMVKTIEQCKELCVGVYFEISASDDDLFRYTIYTNRIQIPTNQRYVTDSSTSSYRKSREYVSSQFIELQHSIDREYINSVSDGPDVPLEIHIMPSMRGGHFQNAASEVFGYIFPIMLIVLLENTFIVPLVEEKQDGLKDFLVIATPLSFLNGVAFYAVRLAMYLLFAAALLMVASAYDALGIMPAFLVFVLFLLFILSSMSYSYLVSVLFNSVCYAKNCCWLLLLFPLAFTFISGNVSTAATYLFCLKTFYEAWNTCLIFGNKLTKFSYSDVYVNVTESSFSLIDIYCILILQWIGYSLLYLYLSNVLPGPNGMRKSYLFFLKRDFYQKSDNNDFVTNESTADAIIIEDLMKEFQTSGPTITIADHLNMTIKNKEITVLLGHNGAGKTTTLNMIMGTVPKDGGKIVVCSERDASSYRHLIGYCPQHSIYMQYMTCRQHLLFFAQLRGMSRKEAGFLTNRLLEQLNLVDKANEFGKNLSGGMRRRLSLGIALAGDTRVVVLDEPSSGLDIESRRELWDILLELRKTKAILLTTHHMEEAEVLGDTICILSNGRLQLTGSPLELKRKVGSGYLLKLCTEPAHFREDEVLELIREDIPSASILSVIPPTVVISLSYGSIHKFSGMLQRLEQQQQSLGINTISVTDTTLEDVFLSSGPKNDEVDGACNSHRDHIYVPYQRLGSLKSVNWFQQVMTIAYKKLLFLKAEWPLVLSLISLPFVMATVAIVIIISSTVVQFGEGLHLNLAHYKQGIIYVNIPEDADMQIHRISEILHKEINSHDGIQSRNLLLTGNNTVDEELEEIMSKDFARFQQTVIGTIQISDEERVTMKLFYSENMWHSPAILTNLIDNVIFMMATQSPKPGIEAVYAPVAIRDTRAGSLQLGYYATFISFGMFSLMFLFAMLPFKEHKSGFKRLQVMPSHVYWLAVLTCDVVLLLLICLGLFLYQALIMPKELYKLEDQLTISCSLFFYGLTYLPLLYCVANVVTTLSAFSTFLVTLFYVCAILPFLLSTNVSSMIKYQNYITFLRLLPDFNLAHQLRIVNERFVNNYEARIPQEIRDEINNKDVLNQHTFYSDAILTFVLLMICFVTIVENKNRRHYLANILDISCWKRKRLNPSAHELDRLVLEEKTAVDKVLKDNTESEYPLLVHNLHKCYDCQLAVCGLNFAVRKKECFGLLGVNGAGKTTTFEMIAAHHTITAGTIKIDGVDILTNELEYKYRFGYCPQNDCLNDFMTAYQTLYYMARLRGIDAIHVRDEVLFWLNQLDLFRYKDIQVRHYSGGTKRKLQTAAAMIGSPSLLLLDEPTTGVDPVSRRFLWKSIQEFQKRNKTIVLTSHSMDECEHLCNRLAIMAEGQFKCLGYVPELKQIYGSGFTISIKMQTTDYVDFITDKLQQQFPCSQLRENHAGILTYFIRADDTIRWSKVFELAERFVGECEGLIDDYSVNETTLEDIFLKYDTKNRCRSQAAMSPSPPIVNI